MLKVLRIKNLAIIEDISLEFEEGLNILTGETGAGKSIIIDALGLALGSRASGELVRSGEETATVELLIELADNLQPLDDMGIDNDEGGPIIRRTLSTTGKSRAYINSAMVNNQALGVLGRCVIDIHGQFSHQSLLFQDKQLEMLDRFAGLMELRAEAAAHYKECNGLKNRLKDLELQKRERATKEDFLKFQINEIESAHLRVEEDEELQNEFSALSNMTKLIGLAHEAHEALYASERSALTILSKSLQAIRQISLMDERVKDSLSLMENAEALLQDASHFIMDYKDSLEINPQRLDEVQDRLELFRQLKKKYGGDIQEVLAYSDNALIELQRLQSISEETEALTEQLAQKKALLTQTLQALSQKRKEEAVKIEKLVENELHQLAMEKSRFSIAFHSEVGDDTTDGFKASVAGIDKVEYMLSPNPGEDLKPLSKITSGGELSRIMLALKSILSQQGGAPVLVFDEVDTGVGGKTAITLGRKLRELSANHQVICITHLPQIAVFGNSHLKIEKIIQDDRTRVVVKKLQGQQQVEEIARMLSGSLTEASLDHAKELIVEATK
jgi:DNA repair protein RecN (Recombination protein N)